MNGRVVTRETVTPNTPRFRRIPPVARDREQFARCRDRGDPDPGLADLVRMMPPAQAIADHLITEITSAWVPTVTGCQEGFEALLRGTP